MRSGPASGACSEASARSCWYGNDPVTAQASSPEGLYLAAVTGGAVHWIDALRATELRTTRAFDEAGTVANSAQFSPDGRWLLLRLQRGRALAHALVDVTTGQVVWDKPSVQARFDTEAPQVRLQGPQGELESVRLP